MVGGGWNYCVAVGLLLVVGGVAGEHVLSAICLHVAQFHNHLIFIQMV